MPVSGSAYTFSYATLGEFVAFIIGWDLILEYGVAVAAVAVGWGGNLNAFLESVFGIELPTALSTSPSDGGVVNLPAVFIVMLISILLTLGTRESARANAVMVGIKIVILVFFIVVAFTAFQADHFEPVRPRGIRRHRLRGRRDLLRLHRLRRGDHRHPRNRRTPDATCPSPSSDRSSSPPCSTCWSRSPPSAWPRSTPCRAATPRSPRRSTRARASRGRAALLAAGALIAITSVILVLLYGQTRIFFAMCRDGLLPRRLAKVNPRFGTPARLTLGFGTLIAVLAALVPLDEIVKLVNIGTLFAFVLVNVGVIILRRTRPDMKRPFRVPGSPVVPLIGILLCAYLIAQLPWETWVRFVGWLVAGLIIYFTYSIRHSRLRRGEHATRPADAGAPDAAAPDATPGAGEKG